MNIPFPAEFKLRAMDNCPVHVDGYLVRTIWSDAKQMTCGLFDRTDEGLSAAETWCARIFEGANASLRFESYLNQTTLGSRHCITAVEIVRYRNGKGSIISRYERLGTATAMTDSSASDNDLPVEAFTLDMYCVFLFLNKEYKLRYPVGLFPKTCLGRTRAERFIQLLLAEPMALWNHYSDEQYIACAALKPHAYGLYECNGQSAMKIRHWHRSNNSDPVPFFFGYVVMVQSASGMEPKAMFGSTRQCLKRAEHFARSLILEHNADSNPNHGDGGIREVRILQMNGSDGKSIRRFVNAPSRDIS